jgi:hypothetical protein
LALSRSVRHVDAPQTDAYLGAVPADLVLLCGIFGDLTDSDVQQLQGRQALLRKQDQPG